MPLNILKSTNPDIYWISEVLTITEYIKILVNKISKLLKFEFLFICKIDAYHFEIYLILSKNSFKSEHWN